MQLFFLGLVWGNFILFLEMAVILSLAVPPDSCPGLTFGLVFLSSFGLLSDFIILRWRFDSRFRSILLHCAGGKELSVDSRASSCQLEFLDWAITLRAKQASVEVLKFKCFSVYVPFTPWKDRLSLLTR
jgi:hypothetical protein